MSNLPKSVRLLDARRLTGINVVWAEPSAVLDIAVAHGEQSEALFKAWSEAVVPMLDALEWPETQYTYYQFKAGISIALAAPIDRLYAAVEIAEWALSAACRQYSIELHADDIPSTASFSTARDRLHALAEEERYTPTLDLQAAAASNGKTFLWDDDEVSLGLGRYSESWPARSIPSEPDWSKFRDIPVALVTGTNGKTTTVRLATRMLRAADHNVGLSSTDWIGVNDRIIDRGDYSGPGGARTVLRQTDVDVAILETARGGLLRRGLGVDRADVALITNIAEDHLGDFGSQDLGELLELKWLVTKALGSEGIAVLNADDPLLVAKSDALAQSIVWFSTIAENPVIARHVSGGGMALTVLDGNLGFWRDQQWTALAAIKDIPITMGGIARHNVANALAASALCLALSVPNAAVIEGLCGMQLNDNPGRCNLYAVDGYEVLLDFAHNPDAMEALFAIAQGRPANRRILCFGQAGDRTDAQISALAKAAWAIGLDRIVISELGDYRRGRDSGEVFALLKNTLLDEGAELDEIAHYDTEAESLADAMQWAAPGDLVIMLALSSARELTEVLQQAAAN